MRRTESLRRLVRSARVSLDNLVMPVFVCSGRGKRIPVPAMAGYARLSKDEAVAEAGAAYGMGIRSFILFGIPPRKDPAGTGAYDDDGVVQQAVRELRRELKDAVLITDVCLCEYTSHGHCGVVARTGRGIDNDATIKLLGKTAVSHAAAGADMVAPSAMMDGQVGAIRDALDRAGFFRIPIMAYSAKYASSFYGPFRDAAGSRPAFGDRRTYQMDPAGGCGQALRAIALDVAQGADIVMVKPALAYLDIVALAKARVDVPVAAFNVSGEYAMIKAYCGQLLEGERSAREREMVSEILAGIARAGADIIVTYHAPDVAAWSKEG